MTSNPLPPEWEYLPDGWPRAKADGDGWAHPSIPAAMMSALPDFIRVVGSNAALGIYPMAPRARSDGGHNISMTFGYVLARAAFGRANLSVLDWGGALGHYALMARALMPELPLAYTIKDLPEICGIGRQLLSWVTFESDEAACFQRRYDLVISSASLPYSEDWQRVFATLANAAAPWLFVTRLPIVHTVPSFVVLQRPHAIGYHTEYPTWVLNRGELVGLAEQLGLALERELIAGPPQAFPGAPETSEHLGFLFRRKS